MTSSHPSSFSASPDRNRVWLQPLPKRSTALHPLRSTRASSVSLRLGFFSCAAAFRVAVAAATNKVRTGVRGDDIVVAVREVIRFLEKHATHDEKYPELAEFVQRYKDGLYRYTAHGACEYGWVSAVWCPGKEQEGLRAQGSCLWYRQGLCQCRVRIGL